MLPSLAGLRIAAPVGADAEGLVVDDDTGDVNPRAFDDERIAQHVSAIRANDSAARQTLSSGRFGLESALRSSETAGYTSDEVNAQTKQFRRTLFGYDILYRMAAVMESGAVLTGESLLGVSPKSRDWWEVATAILMESFRLNTFGRLQVFGIHPDAFARGTAKPVPFDKDVCLYDPYSPRAPGKIEFLSDVMLQAYAGSKGIGQGLVAAWYYVPSEIRASRDYVDEQLSEFMDTQTEVRTQRWMERSDPRPSTQKESVFLQSHMPPTEKSAQLDAKAVERAALVEGPLEPPDHARLYKTRMVVEKWTSDLYNHLERSDDPEKAACEQARGLVQLFHKSASAGLWQFGASEYDVVYRYTAEGDLVLAFANIARHNVTQYAPQAAQGGVVECGVLTMALMYLLDGRCYCHDRYESWWKNTLPGALWKEMAAAGIDVEALKERWCRFLNWRHEGAFEQKNELAGRLAYHVLQLTEDTKVDDRRQDELALARHEDLLPQLVERLNLRGPPVPSARSLWVQLMDAIKAAPVGRTGIVALLLYEGQKEDLHLANGGAAGVGLGEPLNTAIRLRKPRVVAALLAATPPADVDLPFEGASPLVQAIRLSDLEMVRLLLLSARTDGALLEACSMRRMNQEAQAVIKELLKQRANPHGALQRLEEWYKKRKSAIALYHDEMPKDEWGMEDWRWRGTKSLLERAEAAWAAGDGRPLISDQDYSEF